MVKGHMQDGKFHPHTDYNKGVRKSRDQKAKTKGVMIRKARSEPSNIFLTFMKENPKFSAVSGYDKLKDHPKVFRAGAGSFTQSLWDGDIEEAIQRADPINKKALEKILFVRKAREATIDDDVTVVKFDHADRRTGFGTMHLGEFRIITILPERDDFFQCKVCGGLEAID